MEYIHNSPSLSRIRTVLQSASEVLVDIAATTNVERDIPSVIESMELVLLQLAWEVDSWRHVGIAGGMELAIR